MSPWLRRMSNTPHQATFARRELKLLTVPSEKKRISILLGKMK